MGGIYKIIAGIGLLIFAYLVLSKGDTTANIIKVIAGNSVDGIKALQGR